MRSSDRQHYESPTRTTVKRWAANGHTHCFRMVVRSGGRDQLQRLAPSLVGYVCKQVTLKEESKAQKVLRVLLDPDGDIRLDVNNYLQTKPLKEGWEPRATALFMVARRFLVDTTKQLLSYGAKANIGGTDGMSPLHGVCIEIVERMTSDRYLIGTHRDPDDARVTERARRGMKVMELLCDAGANVNALDGKGLSAMSYLMNKVVKYSLFQRSLDDRHKEYSLDEDVEYTKKWSVAALRFLLDRGACPHMGRLKDGETPLHLALRSERLEIVRMMLNASCGCGPDVLDKPGRKGWTPLELSLKIGHPDFAIALLEAGASIDRQNCDGDRPLTAVHGIASKRLEGRGWDAKDDGDLPYLVMVQKTAAFHAFYEHDADTALQDAPHLMQFAANRGNMPLVKAMLEVGVEPSTDVLLYSLALQKNYAPLECALLTRQWSPEEVCNALELHAAFWCQRARTLLSKDRLKAGMRFRRAVEVRQQSGITKKYPAESTVQMLQAVVSEANTLEEFQELLEMKVWAVPEKEPKKDTWGFERRPDENPKLWPILGANLHALLVYQRVLPFGHLGRLRLYYELIGTLYPFGKTTMASEGKFFHCGGSFYYAETLPRLQDCYRLMQALLAEEVGLSRAQILDIQPDYGCFACDFGQTVAGLLENGIVVDVRCFLEWMVRMWPVGTRYQLHPPERRETKENDGNVLQFSKTATLLLGVLIRHRDMHADLAEQAELVAAEMARISHLNRRQPTVLHEVFYDVRFSSWRDRGKDYLQVLRFEIVKMLLRHGANLNALNVDRITPVELLLDAYRDKDLLRDFWLEQEAAGKKPEEVPECYFLDKEGEQMMQLLFESDYPIHWDMLKRKRRSLLTYARLFPQIKDALDADLSKRGPDSLQCLSATTMMANWYRVPAHLIPPRLAKFVELHTKDRRGEYRLPKNTAEGDRLYDDYDDDVDAYDLRVSDYVYCLSEDDEAKPDPLPVD